MKSSALFVATWFAFSYLSVSGAVQYHESRHDAADYDLESATSTQEVGFKDIYYNWVVNFYGIPQ